MKKEQLALIRSRGFTLLEVLVAIFILTIGIVGVFGFSQQTLSLGSTLRHQLVASYLAQEGVEIVRNIRDTNYVSSAGGTIVDWDDGLAGCVLGCEADYNDPALVSAGSPLNFLGVISDGNGTRYQYGGGGTPTIFQRKITVDPTVANRLDVNVEVLWQEKGTSRNFTIGTELYNWAGF